MSDEGLVIVDGSQLRSLNLSVPELDVAVTGAQLLELADSQASQSLFGLSLPQHLKTAALSRISSSDVDEVNFRRTEFTRSQASNKLNEYLTAIADELRDDPLVVSILDGSNLRLVLEDEDDFAMLAENLFTDLDVDDKGKISKSEIRNALSQMGVGLGIPPFQDFLVLNDILKKHGAEDKEELGQSQFAELLQLVIQEIADALSKKQIVVIQNIKLVNGSRLRKLLSNEQQLNSVMEKILHEKHNKKDDQGASELIKSFFEKNGKELGLPSLSEDNEPVLSLYDTVFSEVKIKNRVAEADINFKELVKEILEKFVEQLEANPVLCDLDN